MLYVLYPWWGSRLINPKGSELYKYISNNNYSTLSTGKPPYWPTDHRTIFYFGLSQQDFQIEDNFDLSSDHSPMVLQCNLCSNLIELSGETLI